MELVLAQREQQRTEHSGILVELKPGGPRNFFLVHDGFGDVTLYSSFARRMPDDLAVIGIVPRNIPGMPLAHTSIEDMAGFYINEVRKRQPRGPYLLGGLCAGGVIAYEMASQLSRNGERIELLAVLEAAVPKTPKRLSITSERIGRLKRTLADAHGSKRSVIAKACDVAGTILRKTIRTVAWEIARIGQSFSANVRFRLMSHLLARKLPWPRFIPGLGVLQIYEIADARYMPEPVDGVSVVLVRAQRRSIFLRDLPCRFIYTDETFGWAAMSRRLTVIDVDGGHSTFIEDPFVGPLAEALAPYLTRKFRASTVSGPEVAVASLNRQ